MRLRNVIAILTPLLLIASCVPTRQFVRTDPTYEQSLPKIVKIGVVSDVCIARDAVGSDDYISIEDSKAAESSMLAGAKEFLTQKDYEIVFQESFFVGAFKKSEMSFKVAQRGGAEVSESNPPFYFSESLSTDEAYKQALIKVISKAQQSIEQKELMPSYVFLSSGNMQESLDMIAKRTNVDAILFLMGNGMLVPVGKSVAQGVATGVLSTALTLGMVTYYQYDVSWLDTYAALIDLKTGHVPWTNSLRLTQGNIISQDYYTNRWSKEVLYHFPKKNK